MQADLSTEFIGLKFKNPVWLGASDATRSGAGVERAIASGAGAVVLKSVTELADFRQSAITRFMVLDERKRPVRGQPAGSYTFFSRGGSMQSIEDMVQSLPAWKKEAAKRDVRLIGSVSAGTPEGWKRLSEQLAEAGADALELNFGNPHARHTDHVMGEKISQSPEAAAQIVRSVAATVPVPLLVKLSPHAPDFVGLVKAVRAAGAAGVTIMHRFQGLMLDVETGLPVLNGYNGIGGSWMKPLTLYWLSRAYNETDCPIVGGNGIDSWSDAAEFILAGAGAVQVSSGVMVRGYGLVTDILSGLDAYLRRRNMPRIADLAGAGARHLLNGGSLTFPPRRAEVDSAICANCPDKPCQDSCFYGALSMEAGAPAIGSDCNGCGMCAFRCPYEGALTLVEHAHE